MSDRYRTYIGTGTIKLPPTEYANQQRVCEGIQMEDRRKQSEYREVYSTDTGALCVECGKTRAACICAARKRLTPLGDGQVRIRRETKGRGGKTVTTISGLAMNLEAAEALLKDLKRICGTGGAVKEGHLELQGDRLEVVIQELAKRGIPAKRAGG